MSPAANDNSTPTRPIRVSTELWRDFGYACEELKTDRSTYLRNVMRWAIHEEGVKAPRRPTSAPVLPRPEPLPAAITETAETTASIGVQSVTRYILKVNADHKAVTDVLIDSKTAKGVSYQIDSPVPVSTIDRDQALRVYKALVAAGLDIVGDKQRSEAAE